MLCYKSEDDHTCQVVTVIFGKDNSPTPLVQHMRVHHHTDYEEVQCDNKLGLSVCDFTRCRNVVVDTLLGTNHDNPSLTSIVNIVSEIRVHMQDEIFPIM